MIQIKRLHVSEFRGIREIELDLNCKSFIVWGPNGSGKSGIVDAIDFALTGDVSRLKGEGYGSINLKEFGPHVLRRDDPESSQVTLTVFDPVSGKSATMKRNLKTSTQFSLDPDLPEVRKAIESAQHNRQVTLSRREIIKYIVARPTDRADYIQDLLKLERVRNIRRLLKSTDGKLSEMSKDASRRVSTAEQELRTRLDIDSIEPDVLCDVVNAQRKVLSLPLINTIDASSDFSAGTDLTPSAPLFDKGAAIREVDELKGYIDERAALTIAANALADKFEVIATDPAIKELWKQRALITSGLGMIIEAICPLCDSEWQDIDLLREHLNEKHARSEEAETLRQEINKLAAQIVGYSEGLRDRLSRVIVHAGSFGPDGSMDLLRAWSENLQDFEGQLKTSNEVPIEPIRLRKNPTAQPEEIETLLDHLRGKLSDLPDLDTPQKATKFLAIAQERWLVLQKARNTEIKATRAAELGKIIYSNYCAISDEFLEKLFGSVSEDFAKYYSIVNQDDEAGFHAKLVTDSGKLDLSVDFYSQGAYPPAAYHSEGHQDGMGVCLYLALMKKLYGTEFRLAVLDDVVMSVDADHRRQFCQLLIDEFPNVQFIITTHDEAWANQILSSGLVTRKNQVQFLSWSVDHGPIYEVSNDFWEKIRTELDLNNVSGAAACLRRNLELTLRDLTEKLGGSVEYRSNSKYELGDFMASVKKRHKELLSKAAAIANSANDTETASNIQRLQQARKQALTSLDAEQWTVNPAVHYNEWANFTKADFDPVIAACQDFLNLFKCDNQDCGSWISLRKNGQRNESLRCKCGSYNLDLA